MNTREHNDTCAFNTLFTKHVPHIHEKIFFSLDYTSFKACSEVNNTWKELFSSESYEKKSAELLVEKLEYEKELWEASKEGNAEEVRRILSSGKMDVNCKRGKYNSTPLN